MILKYVEIKNFRSVSYVKIEFDHHCRILVGINESGKSNILKALAHLSEDYKFVPDDLRQTLPGEDVITEAYIRFVFEYSKEDLQDICSIINSSFIHPNNDPFIVADSKKSKLTIDEFVQKEKQQKLYKVDLIKKTKNIVAWKLSKKYEMLPDFKKVAAGCPDAFHIKNTDGSQVTLKKVKMVHEAFLGQIPAEYLVPATIDDLDELINGAITTYFKDLKPDAILWDYSDKNLLPAQIDLAQFMANPEICIPLKQMFLLAGIQEIKKKLEEEKAISTHRMRNCLNRVAEVTTDHFRETWKEYKSIAFDLSQNGTMIDASIKDEFNHYEFTSRSDGFKRFVTFLLMISVNVKIDHLTDTLILIDEPDICLHPSGARYLRDELINISSKNYVVYSTHSIFMIDRDTIERHIIIKKSKEKTIIENVNTTNILDEEVLYNALGYSIFESLKASNIIFEGWKDKKLFQVALNKLPKEYKNLKTKYESVGLCHAKGVKDVQNITPLLEMANRKCIIVSDNDKAAIEKQREFDKSKGYGKWFKYKDIDPDIEAITGEDFIATAYIVKCIAKFKDEYPELVAFNGQRITTSGKLSSIHRECKEIVMAEDKIKEFIEKLKNCIFDELTQVSIDDTYYQMINKLSDLVE